VDVAHHGCRGIVRVAPFFTKPADCIWREEGREKINAEVTLVSDEKMGI